MGVLQHPGVVLEPDDLARYARQDPPETVVGGEGQWVGDDGHNSQQRRQRHQVPGSRPLQCSHDLAVHHRTARPFYRAENPFSRGTGESYSPSNDQYIPKRHIGPLRWASPREDAEEPRMVQTGGSGTKLPGRIPLTTESTAYPNAPDGASPILAGRSSPGTLVVRGFSVGL